MALTRTLEDTESDASTGIPPTGTTSAFTPADASLLLGVASLQGVNPSPGTMTIADSLGTLTWTARMGPTTPTQSGNYYGRTAGWTAPITTGASMTTTVASSETTSGDDAHVNIAMLAYEGYNTSSPIGATALSTVVDDDARTIVLSAAPASDSEVVAWRARGDGGSEASTATPGSGWTELAEVQSAGAGYNNLQIMVRTGSTSDQVTWDDLADNAAAGSYYTHCCAIEVKAAAGASAAGPLSRGGSLTSRGPLLKGRLVAHSPNLMVSRKRIFKPNGEIVTLYELRSRIIRPLSRHQSMIGWRKAA